MQSERNDFGKVLPKSADDRAQVIQRVPRRVHRAKQLLKVGSLRVHRREEELVLAAETLIEDRFRDAGSLRDLPCRRRMSVLAEEVARDVEHFVVGNRFLAPHAAQYTGDAGRVRTRLDRRQARAAKKTWGRRLTYKRALANL